MKGSTKSERKLINEAIKVGDISKLPDIITIMADTKSISKVQTKSEEQLSKINLVLDKLPNNDYKKIIKDLAEYCVSRKN